VVPLAAGLYMVTTTTWTACERALLHRKYRATPVREAAEAEEGPRTEPPAVADPGRALDQGVSGRRTPPRTAQRGPKTRAARQRAARTRARTAAAGGPVEEIVTTTQ
jgi:YidC/Oxa1 family membrane protein insertase